jgi:hypothetical protein
VVDDLVCSECGRTVGGVSGFHELQNLIAHMAEHHDRTLDLTEALELRDEWLTAKEGHDAR